MPQVPIEPGYFTVPDEPGAPPRLLGSRCESCHEVFFPPRVVCAKCLHEGCEELELSTSGTLWSWTYVHVPLFGKSDADAEGYGIGQIDLPEGPRVMSVLFGLPSDFRIGMQMTIDLETLRTDAAGDDVVIYRFRAA